VICPVQSFSDIKRDHRSSINEITTVRLTVFALLTTSFTVASLLIDTISLSQNAPALSSQSVQQHHGDNAQSSGTLDALAETVMESFSGSWAYYSPYHPAAPFETSTRNGCVVSQVNIVSCDSRPYSVDIHPV
jgi:hypothetical protein